MRDKQMPDEGLERLGVGRDRLRIDDGNEDANVRQLSGGSTVAPHDPGDGRTFFAGVEQRTDEIGADVLFDITSAHGENKERVGRAEAAGAEPVAVGRVPAFIVHARGEFGDVVRDAIGFDAGDFAEIASCVRRVARAAANAEKKEAAAALANVAQEIRGALDGLGVDFFGDVHRLAQILARVGGVAAIEDAGPGVLGGRNELTVAVRDHATDLAGSVLQALDEHVRNSASR